MQETNTTPIDILDLLQSITQITSLATIFNSPKKAYINSAIYKINVSNNYAGKIGQKHWTHIHSTHASMLPIYKQNMTTSLITLSR